MRYIALIAVLLLGACSVAPPTLSGKSGLHVADVAMANGSPMTALQIARTALESDPRNVQALVRVGEAQYALHQNGQAIETFRRTIAIDPSSSRAQIGIARIQLATNPVDAEATLRKALAREAGNAAALNDLGIAQDLQGKHEAAQASYRAALGVEPGLMSTQVNLGLSLALGGRAREGVQMLQPLGESPSSTPKVREDLAAALALAGDERSASDVLHVDLTKEQTVAALTGLAALGNAPQ